MRLSSVLFTSALALVACRGSSDNPGIDSGSNHPGSDGGGSNGSVKIQDVQSDTMLPGTPVSLSGVVVTAIDTFGAKTGAFWVEEPEGGTFSGVQVFNATISDVAALSVGDIIDLTGAEKAEFALTSDTSGLTDTELEPVAGGTITITKTGTGTVPAPVVVDALAIGQMGSADDRNAQWEMYEGVLITVNHVSALNAPREIGSDNTSDQFTITGTAVVESNLAALPGAAGGAGSDAGVGTIVRGDCLDSVTGVIDYFFTYNLLPRSTDEIATGGAGCPAPEQSVADDGTVCTDGLDNDGNGFSDCDDLGCEVGSDAWLDKANCNAATESVCGCSTNEPAGGGIAKLNAGKVGPIIVRNVFVTAVGTTGFWIADNKAAAANGGVFVFTSSAPTGVAVGDELDTLQGIVAPFNKSKTGTLVDIEFGNATVGTKTGTGNVVTALTGQTAATLSDLTAGAPFAGSLVTVPSLKVASINTQFDQVTMTDPNGKTLILDDEAFAFFGGSKATPTPPAVGTCLTVTGVMDANTFDPQIRTLNPRGAADLVAGTGCK